MTPVSDTVPSDGAAAALARIGDSQFEIVTDQKAEAQQVQEIEDAIQRAAASAPDDDIVESVLVSGGV
jgi:ABC-type sugar transport system substrate-binding protein